ncbi:MAG: hypothetical protein B7Y25_08165 [Alphaproteobacteria bacterium 16-39-46]|nr:MAG: hypothetical protein B7Y25_08165 [Alphaproteobacteria bacterium 16-39-46]OZA41266.1 MAG: hypothetical protein B7X84_08295 [Alphaproteobacteria bacterium 17-39-52]HQS84592.1 DUF2066 domain-containing protein [Alphaproteobacteria bacterium]HQS94380.1 DUF2066 domain-containing protein [Alphaproteobacteria bacterium]
MMNLSSPLKHVFVIVLSVLGGGILGNLACPLILQNSALGSNTGNENISPFYTIEDISVDVTEISALVAREKALEEGQQKALYTLLERLSGRPLSFWELSLKSLTEEEFSHLVADFETTQEKSSPVRYMATLTYRFKKKGIDALLSKEGINPQNTITDPVLVLPLLKVKDKTYLWEDENLWRHLWQEGSLASSNVPLLVPLGDLEDIQSLDASHALTENFTDLNTISDRYKATGGALVILAELSPDPSSSALKYGLPLKSHNVNITIFGGLPSFEGPWQPLTISSEPQESTKSLLDRALREVIKSLNNAWSRNVLEHGMGKQTLSLEVRLSSQKDWFSIRSILTNLKNHHVILNFGIQRLTAQSVTIILNFRGDIMTLVPRFKEDHLDLLKKEGLWTLEKSFETNPSSSQAALSTL